jgi:hypothetical protein
MYSVTAGFPAGGDHVIVTEVAVDGSDVAGTSPIGARQLLPKAVVLVPRGRRGFLLTP